MYIFFFLIWFLSPLYIIFIQYIYLLSTDLSINLMWSDKLILSHNNINKKWIMPTIFLERLPIPSLRTYVSFSVMLLGMAIFYAHQTVRAKINYIPDDIQEGGEPYYLPPDLANLTLPYPTDDHFWNLFYIMRVETWCIWVRFYLLYMCCFFRWLCV